MIPRLTPDEERRVFNYAVGDAAMAARFTKWYLEVEWDYDTMGQRNVFTGFEQWVDIEV